MTKHARICLPVFIRPTAIANCFQFVRFFCPLIARARHFRTDFTPIGHSETAAVAHPTTADSMPPTDRNHFAHNQEALQDEQRQSVLQTSTSINRFAFPPKDDHIVIGCRTLQHLSLFHHQKRLKCTTDFLNIIVTLIPNIPHTYIKLQISMNQQHTGDRPYEDNSPLLASID